MFLTKRPRRLRISAPIRKLVRETVLQPENMVYPIFLVSGNGIKQEIESLPGQYHFSVDMLEDEIIEIKKCGILAVLLFGLPAEKDETGLQAYSQNGIVQEGIRKIKEIAPEIIVITDVCLCQYTSHGHCGVIKKIMFPMMNLSKLFPV